EDVYSSFLPAHFESLRDGALRDFELAQHHLPCPLAEQRTESLLDVTLLQMRVGTCTQDDPVRAISLHPYRRDAAMDALHRRHMPSTNAEITKMRAPPSPEQVIANAGDDLHVAT